MDIINSFISGDNKYEYIKLSGDSSSKKHFYRIKCEGEYLDQLLIKISTTNNDFDEYFDAGFVYMSQYDFFKYIFELLHHTIGYVPKINAFDSKNGIVLMDYVSELTAKDYLMQNVVVDEEIYMKMVDWLVKLNKADLHTYYLITTRHFGSRSIQKEITEFKEWVLYFMTGAEKCLFEDELRPLIESVDPIKTGPCHRDYQTRNALYHNNDIYIIDIQDMCIGPYMHDLACLLYESNFVMDGALRDKLMLHYYDRTQYEPFEDFKTKVKLLGLLRLLKGYGRHMRYFIKDTRWQSMPLIMNAKIMLGQMAEDFPCLNLLDKYKTTVIILAAGKGSRMNASVPKALCEINGMPMIYYLLNAAVKLNPDRIIVVVGHQKELIVEKLKEYPYPTIEFVEQAQQLGTGHAVKQTQSILSDTQHVLVLFGDNPHISYQTLRSMVSTYYQNNYDGMLLSYKDALSHTKCGRIIKENGRITHICEDAGVDYPSDEFCGGAQMYRSGPMFDALDRITTNNKQNEYYLCDIVKIIADNGGSIGSLAVDKSELLNVNTVKDIEASKLMLSI